MSVVPVEAVVDEVESWEVHSELVLVSPEVCRRALELLPERDPDAFLIRTRMPIAGTTSPSEESDASSRLPALALRYTFWRLGKSARFALGATIGSVGIALIAEVVR